MLLRQNVLEPVDQMEAAMEEKQAVINSMLEVRARSEQLARDVDANPPVSFAVCLSVSSGGGHRCTHPPTTHRLLLPHRLARGTVPVLWW